MPGNDGSDPPLSPQEPPWLAISHHDGAREHVRLTLALTTIGRSEKNVIELLDPKLSRYHCELERRAQGFTVRDCSSRNGTLVNGEAFSDNKLLADGDRVKIGRSLLTFHTKRPAELRTDPALMLHSESDVTEIAGHDTPHLAQRRPTGPRKRQDRRQTVAIQASGDEKPWRFLTRASAAVLDAPSRGRLLETTVELSKEFLQAHGALIVLGTSADAMTITASLGVAGEDKQRCMAVAGRVLTTRAAVLEDRRAVGLPLRGPDGPRGALVLHDLAGAPDAESPELGVLQAVADLAGRTVGNSLRLEEVRRDERAAGARRIADDLRLRLRPEPAIELPGLEIGVADSVAEHVGRDFWDRIHAPSRAGREEVYFAVGDVPDADAPVTGRLRRRGERSFVSLLGQAELRGALRSLIETLPRTSDLITQLGHGLRRGCSVERLSIVLCRFDPTAGTLRFSGAGHEPVLIRRRDGTTEALECTGPPLGMADEVQASERDLRLEPGDQVLLSSAASRVPKGSDGGSDHCESLASIFARMAVPAQSAEEVAQRILYTLQQQRGPSVGEGLTLVLLRRR